MPLTISGRLAPSSKADRWLETILRRLHPPDLLPALGAGPLAGSAAAPFDRWYSQGLYLVDYSRCWKVSVLRSAIVGHGREREAAGTLADWAYRDGDRRDMADYLDVESVRSIGGSQAKGPAPPVTSWQVPQRGTAPPPSSRGTTRTIASLSPLGATCAS
jgi:hypothetical protein